MIYAAIIAAALNLTDKKGLFLALLVGLSIAAPISPEQFCGLEWYVVIALIDMIVAVVALLTGARASVPLFVIHMSLVLFHCAQSVTAPYADQESYYPQIVPSLELFSLLCLCYTSKTFSRLYHGQHSF